jgi:signal transduction histidine kinase
VALSKPDKITRLPVFSQQRASHAELENDLRTVSHSPIVSALLEAVDAGLLVLNREGQILATNRAPVLANLRHENRRAIGLRPGEFFRCPRAQPKGCGTGEHCLACGTLQAVTQSQSGGTAVERECLLTSGQGRDAKPLEMKVRATQVEIEGKPFTVVSLRDISHEKRRQALERVFFHDILNTLSALSNWTHLLKTSEGERLERAHERVRRLVTQLEREIQVQRALLDAEHGKLHPRNLPVTPSTLLDEMRALFGEGQAAVGRTFMVEDACAGIELETDPVLLSRVLINMLKNAFEATPTGGQVRLWCETESDGQAFWFHVHNPGLIPPEVAARIFQRSFTTKGDPGRGLGTYSMKLLGERYLGGEVSFTTSETQGTTFSIRLPLPSPLGAGI